MSKTEHAYISLAIKDELPLERIRVFNMGKYFDIITDSNTVTWDRSTIVEYNSLAYYIYLRVVNPEEKAMVLNTNFGFSELALDGTTINQLNIIVTYLKMLSEIIKIEKKK
jgi:hypothetical protein